MSEALTVVNNVAPLARVEAQKSALSRLFTLKPATIELVSKSTQQEGAIPGKFRNTATNEHFDTMRAVILFEPVEQRALYTPGTYSKDSKICFSLDNVTPHQAAKDPKAMSCANCDFGEKNWVRYREGKKQGVSGKALSELSPPCKKYWHLFLADRITKMPNYFNVKGISVAPFEAAMQNVARIFAMMISNTRLENQQITEHNKANPADLKPLKALPTSVGDVIWQIVFTMFVTQPEKGGQYAVGFKDFAVMKPEDYAEFGTILNDIAARRAANQLQPQVDSEAENAENSVVEQPNTVAKEVADKNAQITI